MFGCFLCKYFKFEFKEISSSDVFDSANTYLCYHISSGHDQVKSERTVTHLCLFLSQFSLKTYRLCQY